jgi:hypothetical protein
VWEIRGVFEGDDGINARDPKMKLTEKDFKEVGFECKMKTSIDMSGTDFCSLVFDEIERVPVTDIYKAYVKFGWGTGNFVCANTRRKLELLRAKSYSLLYQYPGCPVLYELARYGLRVTKWVSMQRFLRTAKLADAHKWELFLKAYDQRFELEKLQFKECPRTRDLIARRFGISVIQQLDAEKYLRELNVLQPLTAFTTCLLPHAPRQSWCEWVRPVKREELVLGKHIDLPVKSQFDNFGDKWWERHGDQVRCGKLRGREIFTAGNSC